MGQNLHPDSRRQILTYFYGMSIGFTTESLFTIPTIIMNGSLLVTKRTVYDLCTE